MPEQDTITIHAYLSSPVGGSLRIAHTTSSPVKVVGTSYYVVTGFHREGECSEFTLQEYRVCKPILPPAEALAEPGAKAALRSGGPVMTVMSVDGDNVKCVWSTGDGYCERTFPAAVLSIGKLSKGE